MFNSNYSSSYKASNKAYIEKLREENSIHRTLETIKSKKLQNETNKRRRIASAKARAQEEAEEKRRQAILAQRRAELEEATARFQRGHRTYKLLQQRRHFSTDRLCSPPLLEDALRAIGSSPRNQNNTETTISQVKLASNSFRNTRNSKSLFEQQLEKHQQILQQQQQEQLVKFNSAIWKEINGDSKVCGVEEIEIDNKEDLNSSSSSLTSIDSLEQPTSSVAVKHSSLLNSTNVAVVTPNNHTTPPPSQDGDCLQSTEQHSPTYQQVVKELTFTTNNVEIKKESQVESMNVQHKDINNSPLTAIHNSNKITTAESIVKDRPQDIQVRVAEVKMKPNTEVVHLKHEEQSKSPPETSQNGKAAQHGLQSYPPNKYGARPLPQPPPCSEPPNNSPVEDKEDVDSVAEEIFPAKRRAQSATVRRQAKEDITEQPLKGILKKRPVQSAPLGKRGNTRGSTVKDSLEIIRGRGIDNLDLKQSKRNVHFATVLCEEAEFNEHLSTITRLTSNSTTSADKENNNANYMENNGSCNDHNTHQYSKIPKSTTSLKPKPPQGPPPAATIRRRIISANSTIPTSTSTYHDAKHTKPIRVQSAPPRTSVQGLYKSNKLERTPTDDEINWLWDRVRTCLQQKPEEAPKVSQKVVDGSSLMRAGTVQRISSARNPLQTQSAINRRKVNMEMLSAYSRKQPGGNIIVQERPNQFAPKCNSNVSESMAGFLAAEALTEQQHSVTESQLENALEQAKRQQFVHNQQRSATPTSLSVEEQKLRQSLERLDEKLKNYTNVIDGSVKITSFAPRQQQVYVSTKQI
ncbi:DgyrCDS7340 [Dimorphilus gyrociliatus]|uniref:DgyrCDS7340 n=1 Tax=Dimorphilus gyrociliatus TaxID=2664684 RepID=A0A7I8VT00_9ANNE|nr:DgyrCDS7340 [Dimorphilus gyrociliatus]